jgi:3'-phosphoadenosine 5'-phosphosulfate sulfotransferase (PAPS reductase)/FAD synthetase
MVCNSQEMSVLPGSLGKRETTDLVNESLGLIKTALSEHNKPTIAFSGGKDSLVVLDLVRQINPDIPAVFCNTGIEYPETIKYVKTIPNITWVKCGSGYNYWKDLDENGLNGKKGNAGKGTNELTCCRELKNKPSTKYYKENKVDLVFTGLTAAESRNRWMFFRRMGPYYFFKQDKYWKCHPVHNWTPDNIWDYIFKNDLRYNELYNISGIKRCGCRWCTAYKTWESVTSLYSVNDTKRLLKYKRDK